MASQLATYDQAKEPILARRGTGVDGLATNVTASFTKGLVADAASNPVDMVKTQDLDDEHEGGARSACLIFFSKRGIVPNSITRTELQKKEFRDQNQQAEGICTN